MESKTVFTFTKDMEKQIIKLEGYNEIISAHSGFAVIEVAEIEIEYKNFFTGQDGVRIFLKNDKGSIVAKDIVFNFEDNDKLVLEQVCYDFGYKFKVINGGV